MYELKPIHADAIPAALSKAERYRLLNEPREAESICRDVLAVSPDNVVARICLTLAISDQFSDPRGVQPKDALAVVEQIADEYERTYLTGVVYERWAKAELSRGMPADGPAFWIREAMQHFAAAEKLAPSENDEAVLRWNACVRLMQRDARLQSSAPSPAAFEQREIPLE